MKFFNPDQELLKSIAEYANGRVIIDIGCGNADVIEYLHNIHNCKVVGVEPFMIDSERILNLLRQGIHIIPNTIEKSLSLITGGKENILILFCRPCHSDFVENCLDMKNPETEALYITIPQNLEKYNDLGKFYKRSKQIYLKGTSEDNEIILSIC